MPHEALFDAAARGDRVALMAEMKKVVAHAKTAPGGGPVIGDLRNAQGHNLAECAVWNRQLDVLKDILGFRVDHRIRGLFEPELAIFAARSNRPDALRALDQMGVSMTGAFHGRGERPADIAARLGHVEVLEALHGLGVDLTLPGAQGMSPAGIAARQGQVDALKALHRLGVNVAKADENGYTPAHWAALFGQAGALETLHQLGVSLTEPGPGGRTPFDFAVGRERSDALAALIDVGVPIPQPLPQGLGEVGSQRVNQAVMQAVIARLKEAHKTGLDEVADDLTCPVSKMHFDTKGPYRPVSWTDGGQTTVLTASAATEILKGPNPRHPSTRRIVSVEEGAALMDSEAFQRGDWNRLYLLKNVREVMLDLGPDGQPRQLRPRDVVRPPAAPQEVPQWRAVLDQQTTPTSGAGQGPRRDAGAAL